MHRSGFVTPFEEPSHHLPMRSSQHERPHRGFCCPHSASPERLVSVTKHRRSEITLRIPSLSDDGRASG
jgi:hypothetical protein